MRIKIHIGFVKIERFCKSFLLTAKPQLMTRIVALSGSLREKSSSHIVLDAIRNLLPDNVDFLIYNGIATLPHFDDREIAPEEVQDFRKQLQKADGVLICTPEYAFGIPGALKNALDWTVGSGELVNKPVALVTASSSGEKGHAAMLLVLAALSADVPTSSTLLISFVRAKIKEGKVSDPETIASLQRVIDSLISQVPSK